MHLRYEHGMLGHGGAAPSAALTPRAPPQQTGVLAEQLPSSHAGLMTLGHSGSHLVRALRCRAGEPEDRRLHFELPFTGKVLLLAAYLCSHNRPALDRRLFDASARAGRRRGNMAADRQVRCKRAPPCDGSLLRVCEHMHGVTGT